MDTFCREAPATEEGSCVETCVSSGGKNIKFWLKIKNASNIKTWINSVEIEIREILKKRRKCLKI